jgi:hypothetical protein
MDIQLTKADIIKRFQQINDESLITAIKSLLDYAQSQKEKSKKDIFSQNTDADMIEHAERSERDIAEGRTISGAQFKENIENWKKKKHVNIR